MGNEFIIIAKKYSHFGSLSNIKGLLNLYDEQYLLSALSFKDYLNDMIYQYLNRSTRFVWTPLQKPLHVQKESNEVVIRMHDDNHSPDTRLTMNPSGFFTKKARFSTINLVWRGTIYKHMRICVDIVPSFQRESFNSLPRHYLLPQNEQLHIIVCGYPINYQLGYSLIENHVMKNLPEHVRLGYKYAKGMRCSLVLSCVKELEHIDNFEDRITS